MLQNYLAAAFRNLFRNGAYAAINILGLALGFTTVILIALFVRDEYSFDRMYPEYRRTYRVMETVLPPGERPLRVAVTASNIAGALQLEFPEVEAVTRLSPTQGVIRHGEIQSTVQIYWADPNFFDLFPIQALSGNPVTGLQRPDGIVITRKVARQFFGRDDVVGQVLELDRKHVLHVAAVLEDLPSNTHLDTEIVASGLASYSVLTAFDSIVADSQTMRPESTYTYLRLRPGAQLARLNAAMPDFATRNVGGEVAGYPISKAYHFMFVPIADIHLQPGSVGDAKSPGDARTLQTLIGIAALILIVAASNFVGMMTARAAARAVEVGVRKAEGATRLQIILQFLGECLFYTGLALVFAILCAQWALPALNAYFQRDIEFRYLSDSTLGGAILLVWIVTALAAGAYAALVMSMFSPGAVLKGQVILPGRTARLRQTLVVFQFGTLIALIVSTLTIQQQTRYAMEDRLRLPGDQIYFGRSGCPAVFRDAVSRLPGVLAATCSSGSALAYDRFAAMFDLPSGKVSLRVAPVDYGFHELFGIKPLAGRLFSPDRGEDDLLRAEPHNEHANPSIVINESAAKALGYLNPQAAVSQYKRWARNEFDGSSLHALEPQSSRIIGVVPDFSVGSVRDVIEPMAYYIDPENVSYTVLKLDGPTIPETLRRTRLLWKQTQDTPFEGFFLSQRVNDLYAGIQRESNIFSVSCGVAVVVAALGLLGLAVFTAERRTREIGVRKVMGASRWDILRFLGWQFARPVLWANAFAWPLAYLLMRHWLEGFAYHIDLSPAAFVGASALAVVVAFGTVLGHALRVARAKPVEALRYE